MSLINAGPLWKFIIVGGQGQNSDLHIFPVLTVTAQGDKLMSQVPAARTQLYQQATPQGWGGLGSQRVPGPGLTADGCHPYSEWRLVQLDRVVTLL